MQSPQGPGASSSSVVVNEQIPNGSCTSPQAVSPGSLTKRPGILQLRSSSLSKTHDLEQELKPDDLFTKHTVSEVRNVRQQLREDADKKQEELRVMVGERYRDLLQASTSIISMAKSAQHVKYILEQSRDSIRAQEEPPDSNRTSVNGTDDHLLLLQSLSAHMKLLLDTPEHLWRFIERRKYFLAAWLFLLARVVHRALLQDEGSWSSRGLDIAAQFPLVQRQWESISQFRSQIVHKATISLREPSPPDDICATLLTLHLLDSQPLVEALSVYLTQRSKALHAIFSKSKVGQGGSHLSQPNGHSDTRFGDAHTKTPTQLVKDDIQATLDLISNTLTSARRVFHEAESQSSLIKTILEHIQSDSHHSQDQPTTSKDLYITTPYLLTSLPSSTHFLLLPSNIRSYKPYVDVNSSSSTVPPAQLSEKLDNWFRRSAIPWKSSITQWFSKLQNFRDVWSIRSSTRTWILASGLDEQEYIHLTNLLDDVCQDQILSIWTSSLSSASRSFKSQLEHVVLNLRNETASESADVTPTEFLFHSPLLPVLPKAGLTPLDTSFQKYKSELHRQLACRTPSIDNLLKILEDCAKALNQDFRLLDSAQFNDCKVLTRRLKTAYQPLAEHLCIEIIDILKSASTAEIGQSQGVLDGLIFVSRLANDFSLISPFISRIGCQQQTVQEFRGATEIIRDGIIDRWRDHTVSSISQTYCAAFQLRSKFLEQACPSADLLDALLTLSRSIRQLGICQDYRRRSHVANMTLRQFLGEILGGISSENSDLPFLWEIVECYGLGWADMREKLLQANDGHEPTPSHSLPRLQSLFANLLPPHTDSDIPSSDKMANLLPFGSPSPDTQYQPAVELAKPSSRLGLLLVDDSDMY
ncbi:hypothetical protein BD779DRAFT_52580 [Infundibulicybe gibba]|nr:hypothetical protein BD779DRAFT_52580 [Infundibulicybe gibba]